MSIFFKDIIANKKIDWDTLVKDLNNTITYNKYCLSSDFYEIFKKVIVSLLLNKPLILLDSDLSIDEKKKLTGHSDFDKFNIELQKSEKKYLQYKSDIFESLKNVNDQWSLTLFTSGTTGLPKKVKHNFDSITRFVKISNTKKEDVWGFAFNPTHIAGIQVFLQAFLNGNTIVRLFGLSKDDILNEIDKNKITHISATPTFYRLLLPVKKRHLSVLRLTSGGERFDNKIMRQLQVAFPNAKITNIYASTEAGTLLASKDNFFILKSEYKNLIKVENNELIIHRTLMGQSEISKQEWYFTGDLVEVVEREPLKFRFVSRKNEMMNIGGYKVNPIEVEETIREIEGVKDVRVYTKKNSVLGYIICCDIIKEDKKLEEPYIRRVLQNKLQEFKIPRVIAFVDTLSITRTGKIKRN